MLLKIYVYGYLNRVQSSRRLERECQRNIELVWLTGRLMPDFKTIADFRKDNGEAIGRVCREFVTVCRRLDLFSEPSVAIDGSKFKAVNARERNFTQAKMQRRLAQIDEEHRVSLATRQRRSPPEAKITPLNEKIATLRAIFAFIASRLKLAPFYIRPLTSRHFLTEPPRAPLSIPPKAGLFYDRQQLHDPVSSPPRPRKSRRRSRCFVNARCRDQPQTKQRDGVDIAAVLARQTLRLRLPHKHTFLPFDVEQVAHHLALALLALGLAQAGRIIGFGVDLRIEALDQRILEHPND
jgi:transposase-like protein DUF772